VKESLITLSPRFSMRRMVKQYMDEFYLPAMSGEQITEPQPATD
jgi:glucan phosphorylase